MLLQVASDAFATLRLNKIAPIGVTGFFGHRVLPRQIYLNITNLVLLQSSLACQEFLPKF